MLKFMKHQHKLTPERIQKQKELFAFHKACYHGFPTKPSAMAWDPELRLLAIATRAPAIRVYGQPGVEVYGQSDECEAAITHLIFLQGQCRLVSLCEDNSLHLWEMKEVKEEEEGGGGGETRLKLVHIKSTSLEGKLKKISVLACEVGGEHVMVGTEGGNIYLLQVASFTMAENIIYQDVVMQNVPEDYKLNPGPVEAIAVHPKEAGRILIGYQRGLVVLWDTKNLCADQTYISTQQLESVFWHADPSAFTTSHNDGSYVVWSALDSSQPADGPHTVYGPFPCKPITKILRPSSKDDGQFTIFSGGMPRASYGDRHTVTAIEGENRHTTFSLSSRVLDFTVVLDDDTGIASCLVILAEEEVVFIDLVTEDWPSYGAPYLASLHSSAITCAYLCPAVANDVLEKIKEAGSRQHARLSPRPWPISGGRLGQQAKEQQEGKQQRDVLLTGHEDGTVQFWEAGTVSLRLLYKLSTAQLFVSEDLGGEGAAAEDDDWPPFRKAGLFDPYSDDPRLGVKKMQMCPYTGTLVVAGTAGQVLVMAPATEAKDLLPKCIDINLVAENDSFVWKSHNKLEMRGETLKLEPGMQPSAILQFFPPASCTSLALHSEWNLVACGTAHGFALFDAAQNKCLLAKSTLSPLDLANTADEGPMSRRKSLKKSLRESFRRLRRGRSQRKTGAGAGRGGATSPTTTSPPPSPKEEKKEEKEGEEELEEGEKVEEVKLEMEDEEAEEVFGVSVEGEGEGGQSGGGAAPLSCPEEGGEEEEEDDDDDEDIIEEVIGDEEEKEEEEGQQRGRSRVRGVRKGDVGVGAEGEGVEGPVPFFYYVTPKRFRSSGGRGERGGKEELREVKGGDGEAVSTPTGLGGRLRGWLQRGESGERAPGGAEGVVEGETKESSLKRLFRRPQSPTMDAAPPRPARLWFTRRTQSERRASPSTPSAPEIPEPRPTTPSTPPRSVTPSGAASDQEQKRRGLTLALGSLRRPHATPSPAPSPSLSPSHAPAEEGRLKRFLRQQSEVVLRPFKRQDPSKRRSAPPGPDPPTPKEEVPELEARHPSISTYIDDTPTAPSAPPIPCPTPPASPTHPQPPSQHAITPTLTLPSPTAPPTHRHSIDISPRSPTRSPPLSPPTLSRRLTFSLPFASTRGGVGGGVEEEGVRPVERAVEARTHTPDHIGSMVRCLHITKCFIANSQAMSATLWAGTNSGSIFVFTIAIPPTDKRQEVPLTVQLGKEIHLKHGAPVLGVWVLDGAGQPLPIPMAVKKDAAPPASTTLPHRVLICSEEQFKVFTLPQLKPFCKFKLTAHEGSRARKLDLAKFVSMADPNYSETCLALATNQGDFSLFSLPDCRRQLYAPHLKKEDISGINSVVFTQHGEALYLTSPSELERISLSAKHITRPRGEVPEVRTAPPLAPPKKKEEGETKQGGGSGGAGGGGGGEGGETSTAATTNTTITTTTTTAAAAAAAVPEDTATMQLKTSDESQNGEKEKEAEGKEGKNSSGATAAVGGGGGEVAAGGDGGGGGGGRKVEEVRENGDNSVLSGDITIDSIRDHIDELKVTEKGGGVEVLCSEETNTTTIATSSTSATTTTISKSTTITASSSTSQESQSIRVVETAITSSTSSSSSTCPPSSSTTTTTTTTAATAAAATAADSNHSVLNGTE